MKTLQLAIAFVASLVVAACASGDASDEGLQSGDQHLEGGDDGNPCTGNTAQHECEVSGCEWSSSGCRAKPMPTSPCGGLKEDVCTTTKGCEWVRQDFTSGGDSCQEKAPKACADLTTEKDCQTKINGCTWSGAACRDTTCGDIETQSECDAQKATIFTKGCHWTTPVTTGDKPCADG
jgi:hypothetical protein